jgi:hypothetical protein
LSRQALDAALEIADLDENVDGLLEANSGIAVKNTGRTGHDRCYTANRHVRVSFGRKPEERRSG